MFRLLSAFLLLFALSATTTPAVAVDPTPTPAPSNDAALYDLLASAGELSPAFDSEQTDYLLDVDVALELFEKLWLSPSDTPKWGELKNLGFDSWSAVADEEEGRGKVTITEAAR